MTAVPPLFHRVLTALRPTTPTTGPDNEEPTAVTRTFVRVEVDLKAHLIALTTPDRIDEAGVTAHGYPRVPLPNRGGTPDYATDAATITRRLCPDPTASRLTAELHGRQAALVQAAADGMGTARGQKARRARELSDAASHLLLAPTQAYADLALMLTVVIAAGEATADDALTFPWLHLGALHTDLPREPWT